MSSKFISHLLLFIAICFFSCSKFQKDSYNPLGDGSQWEYNVEWGSFGGDVQKGKMVVRLDGYENINNKEYHKCITVYSGIPGAESETIYYREADDGIYAINGKFKDSPEYLDTKLPLEVGSSWTSTPPLAVTKSRVLNTETLELIGKTYKDCLRISYSSSSNRGNINGYLLVAKNVGMVKNVMEINGITLDISLEKYQE